MNPTDRDVAEVDRLVRNLTSASRADDTSAGAGAPRPPSRWTNVTVRMPSARRGPGIADRVTRELGALAGRMEPVVHRASTALNDLRDRVMRMPSATTLVRLWVTLAATCAGAMYFWPYAKTYFWGLVIYQSCLGFLLVAGVWGARLSWDARLGAAHTLAVGTVLWAITLGTVNTVTVLRGTTRDDAPTFASASYAPRVRPVAPVRVPAKVDSIQLRQRAG